MRVFLALRVSGLNLTDQRFNRLKQNLDKKKMLDRWVPQQQLHIPFLELGDMGRGSVMSYYERLKPVLKTESSLQLKVSGLWAHPYQQEADMLWIGVQNSRALRHLQSTVLAQLEREEEELIRPHIPLIYLQRTRDVSDLISPFKNLDLGTIQISEVSLLEKLSAGSGVHMVAQLRLSEPRQGLDLSQT